MNVMDTLWQGGVDDCDDDECVFGSMNIGILLMKFLIFLLISHLLNYK
jgi:hypothetical protein